MNFYQQYNIDRGTDELWREMGRTHWENASCSMPEWLHFSQAAIDYIHDQKYESGKHIDRYQRIVITLGDNPTLEAWQEYVHNDPWLKLDEHAGTSEAGRTLWLNRKGEVKHIFRYMPSSVWMVIGPFPADTDSVTQLKKLELCRRLASPVKSGTGEMKW